MELTARFYVSDTGADPVRDWFKALNKPDKVAMGKGVQRVQIG
ncbi:MAG: hypothetical protein ABIY55_22125 [Kofleriaceae bacterium]